MDQHAHGAFVFPVCAAACWQRSIQALGRTEGKLRKGQKKADDQEQGAHLTKPSVFPLP
jgi:hypothetical protein